MQDDEITLFNTCTDLVASKKMEPFPLHLLQRMRPGEWIRVGELSLQLGVAMGDLDAHLFVTWLPDPLDQEGYVVIMFYDDESKWSMAAHYNRARLLGGATPNKSLQPTAAAIPASSRGVDSLSAAKP